MQRWNDKLRPTDLIELDKQAHKMVIAYFIGKFEEKKDGFSWQKIIEGGIFELLERVVLTDIKPPIFYRIKSVPERYSQLNEFVFGELEKYFFNDTGKDFEKRFHDYFKNSREEKGDLNKKILEAAHLYSSIWEFEIIKRSNPESMDIEKITREFEDSKEKYYDLQGFRDMFLYRRHKQFVDLCGQLRFQIRWANLHRVPKTSVLAHSLFVSIITYFTMLDKNPCSTRIFNNFFTGLFHDLPEVLTRDIISPIKKSVQGLEGFIKDYEKSQMEKIVYPLLDPFIKDNMVKFTENEFTDTVSINGVLHQIATKEISDRYNSDEFNPRDGSIVKSADEISALIEAYSAIVNGSKNRDFIEAFKNIKKKYSCNTEFSNLVAQFHANELNE